MELQVANKENCYIGSNVLTGLLDTRTIPTPYKDHSSANLSPI